MHPGFGVWPVPDTRTSDLTIKAKILAIAFCDATDPIQNVAMLCEETPELETWINEFIDKQNKINKELFEFTPTLEEMPKIAIYSIKKTKE